MPVQAAPIVIAANPIAKNEIGQPVAASPVFIVDANGSPVPARSTPRNRRVAWIGDSRTFQAATVVSPETSHLAQGATAWLKFLTRQRFDSEPSDNYGVSGDTTAQMLARVNAMLAGNDAGTVVVLGGTNDRGGGLTYQQSIDNLSAIRDRCLNAGRIVVFLNELPRGDSTNTSVRLTSTNLLIHLRLREWLNGQAQVPGCYTVDLWKLNALAASTTGDCIQANFKDGLHENPVGAYYMAASMQPLFEALFPPRDLLPYSNSDLYDATNNPAGCLNSNPMMEGTGGTFNATGGSGSVADGYSENAGPAWTRVYSKVTSGNRKFQQVVIGGTGTTGGVALRQVISAGQLSIGDKVQAIAEVEFDANIANVSQVALQLLDANTYIAGDFRRSVSTEALPTIGAIAGVMRTPVMTLTSTTLQAQLEMKVLNSVTPAATVRIGSLAVRKVA